jgi:hypothetical protein
VALEISTPKFHLLLHGTHSSKERPCSSTFWHHIDMFCLEARKLDYTNE